MHTHTCMHRQCERINRNQQHGLSVLKLAPPPRGDERQRVMLRVEGAVAILFFSSIFLSVCVFLFFCICEYRRRRKDCHFFLTTWLNWRSTGSSPIARMVLTVFGCGVFFIFFAKLHIPARFAERFTTALASPCSESVCCSLWRKLSKCWRLAKGSSFVQTVHTERVVACRILIGG